MNPLDVDILRLGREGKSSSEISKILGITVLKARKALVKHRIVPKLGLYGSKPVIQYNWQMQMLKEYPSAVQAYCATGISSQNISDCCNGKLRQAGGFKWKFKELSIRD